MKANEAPEKVYFSQIENGTHYYTEAIPFERDYIEYVRKDAFIEKACRWLKSNITNNPNADSVLARNGCVTVGMLIEDFKKYMEVQEQNHTWSDEEKIDFLINLIMSQVKDSKYSFWYGDNVTFVTKEEAIDMLRSLKDRIK